MTHDTTNAPDMIRSEVGRNVLRYAVGRALMCQCGRILDVRAAVSFVTGRERVLCASCFDSLAVVAGPSEISEVLDGRELFAVKSNRDGAAVYVPKPRKPTNPPVVGERWEANVSGRRVVVVILRETSRDRWNTGRVSKRFSVRNERTGRELDVHRNRLLRRV